MKHGDYAWAAIAVGVIAYEAGAPSGQLLSQRMDCYRSRHPLIAHVAVGYVALHLLRWWPQPFDPLHKLAARMGK